MAGSLLVAVIVSQVGVEVGPGIKSVLFALFIYAVGYESGPQFFRSLGRQSIKEIALAAVLAVTGLATVVIMSRLCGFDKGLAAGVAAGGLTQSAIIGTAGDAIAKLGLGADEVKRLQGNVAIGYAVTYIFGSFGAIIVCVNILPRLMRRSIRDDAIAAEAAAQGGLRVVGPGQEQAMPELVGRLFRLRNGVGSVEDIERSDPFAAITIERLQRGGKVLAVSPGQTLQAGDVALVVGHRDTLIRTAAALGDEVEAMDGMSLNMQRADTVLTNKAFAGRTIDHIRSATSPVVRHGVYVTQITRMGNPVPLVPESVVQAGDVISLYGSEENVRRATGLLGYTIVASDKTDFVYLGAGLVVGLLMGLVTAKIGAIPLTLGSGGGALLSGLLFGWYHSKHRSFGAMPNGAVQILKDLGLAGFVVVVGLSAGLQAVDTIRQQGFTIFGVGVVVTLVPLILTMLVGRYLLRYDNAAVFAGALSGSRSANPAFGEVLNSAGNSVPTVPFAITYGLANVLLTLIGPLVVAFV